MFSVYVWENKVIFKSFTVSQAKGSETSTSAQQAAEKNQPAPRVQNPTNPCALLPPTAATLERASQLSL